jgi:two-component system NtrC family sensor kinase
MKLHERLRWLPTAGLALVLASILAVLYLKTQRFDESSYFANVVLVRQLKELDAHWELDVLRSRMGIDANYDALVEPLVELNELQDRLQSVLENQRDPAGGALSEVDRAFHRAVEDKTRFIEHFKSHNSVLRNSLAFLPTAAADIQKAVGLLSAADRPASRQLSLSVNQTLLDTLVYSRAPSEDKSADLQSDLTNLVAAATNTPPALTDALDIFIAHVRTVLSEQPEVNQLLNSIASVPTAALLDQLDSRLSSDERQVALQAQQYRKYLLIFAAALAGLLLYAAIRLIRSHAVINRVNRELQAANETLEQRVQARTRELHEAQSELLTTARQAGMAEIATNVLHNVGNVLNSVNVSAGLMGNRLRETKAQGLADAVQLMNEHAADLGDFLSRDEKGQRLPGYLNKLVARLAAERQGLLEELGSLTKSVDHIKDIVATQQAYAGAICVLEPVQIQDLLEDALRMNAGSITPRQITVVKEVAEVPPVLLDKHSLLQILVNLISNARQAMESVTDRAHRMILGVDIAAGDTERRLRIRVEDNGEGIASENLSRLFVHGFTTRKNGHGFGLHSCALAAKSMHGTLRAHSDGPGKGATFILEVPLKEAA